jgi:Tetratricopeptide repeat
MQMRAISMGIPVLELSARDKSKGEYQEARRLYEESLTIRRDLADMQGIAASLYGLGNVELEEGDYQRGRELLEESLTIRRDLTDTQGIAASLYGLGTVELEEGDYQRGRELLGPRPPPWLGLVLATTSRASCASLTPSPVRVGADTRHCSWAGTSAARLKTSPSGSASLRS